MESDEESDVGQQEEQQQEQGWKCRVCKRGGFATELLLRKHLAAHSSLRRSQKSEKNFLCEVCGYSCPTAQRLRRHLVVHSQSYDVACTICGQKFRREDTLAAHVLFCSGRRPGFPCEVCGRVFSIRSNMWNHMRLHRPVSEEENRFACAHCGKRSQSKAKLELHLRTHTGEKPFRCDHCEKAFRNAGNRSLHMARVHGAGALALFQCSECPKRCTSSSNLRTHVRTHTGARPYSCGQCGRTFTRRQYLTRHLVACSGTDTAPSV